jgi:uncharacterized membrane protein
MPLPPESLSYSDLGGTKQEYSYVVDTSTDRSADEVNLAFAATAAMTRTSIRAWVKFSIDGAGAPTVTAWDASWKGGTITPPIISYEESGNYLVTFPATVLDEQGASHAVNLLACWATLQSNTAGLTIGYILEPRIATANTVSVWITDGPGSGGADIFSTTLTLFVL